MNLRAKTLFFFAVSLLISFSACKSKKNLGQDFVPDNEKIGVYVDSIPLEFSTMRLDSVYSGANGIYMVGQQNYSGVISNDVVTYSRLNFDATTIPIDAVYDSMYITVGKIATVYGDSIQDFTLKIFQTTQTLDTAQKNTARYPFHEMTTEATPIAEATFTPSLFRSDTTSIRMKVADAYARQIFEAAKTSNSDTTFSKTMKSLAYKGFSSQGNTMLAINRSSIAITLYYSASKVPYTINLSPSKSNRVAYSFMGYHNELKGLLANLKNKDTLKSTDVDGKSYLQNYSSLSVKTKVPSFQATIGTKADNILINKAEIFIKSARNLNTYANSYYYPGILYLRYSNPRRGDVKVGNSYYLQSKVFNPSFPVISSYYDMSMQCYRLNVTEYVQDLVDEKLDIRDLIVETTYSGLITLGDGTQNPKNFILKVHYSKLK